MTKPLRQVILEMFSSDDYPRAACVLLRQDDKVLSVSRKDDADDLGLPGGKVDEGESDEIAARRELEEETGLFAGELKFLYGGVCKGGSDGIAFWTTVYVCEDWTGELMQTEEGRIRWVTPDKLLGGSFDDYNRRMLKTLGVIDNE